MLKINTLHTRKNKTRAPPKKQIYTQLTNFLLFFLYKSEHSWWLTDGWLWRRMQERMFDYIPDWLWGMGKKGDEKQQVRVCVCGYVHMRMCACVSARMFD